MTMSSHSLLTVQAQGFSSATPGLAVGGEPELGVRSDVVEVVLLAACVFAEPVVDDAVEGNDVLVVFSVELTFDCAVVELLTLPRGQKKTTKSTPDSPQQALQ